MLATDHLHPVSCKLGPSWVILVYTVRSTAELDLDLGNLQAKSAPQTYCCVPQTIPKPFLLGGRAHNPAERGHSHQGILLKHGLQQCLGR